nr:KxYKxGKxW signal peptide domain-containing protein [Lactobacillus helveticus]
MGKNKLHYKMCKDGKKFVFAAIPTLSFFAFSGVSTVAVHADTNTTSGNLTAATVNSTSDTKSAVSSAATVASSSSATKADSTSASSSSEVKTETTNESSKTTNESSKTTNESSPKTSSVKKNSAQTSTSLQQPSTNKAALTHVDKDNFREYFRLNGSATYDDKKGSVTITPDQNNQVGKFFINP